LYKWPILCLFAKIGQTSKKEAKLALFFLQRVPKIFMIHHKDRTNEQKRSKACFVFLQRVHKIFMICHECRGSVIVLPCFSSFSDGIVSDAFPARS
jgi:hypothetical protein